MIDEPEIDNALDEIAAEIAENVGQNRPLGTIEVGKVFDVVSRTVQNYADGTTTGSICLRALLRFGIKYRNRFPEMTDSVIAPICRAFGGRFEREGDGDAGFLDADGDGHGTIKDVSLHAAEATKAVVDVAANATAPGVQDKLAKSRRHINASERLLRNARRFRSA